MDYEKKYKGALARCEWQLANDLISLEVATDLFREDIESEDERIRKEMIRFLQKIKNCILENYTTIPISEFISYLEKQKEHVPENEGSGTRKEQNVVEVSDEYKKVFECGKQRVLKYPEEFNLQHVEQKPEIISISEMVSKYRNTDEYDDDGHYKGKPINCMIRAYEQGIRDALSKVKEQKPAECLKAERDGWYVCIKDFYAGGKKQCSVGDLVQAKGGMYMMGREDISEWFRRAYYEEVRDAFGPNTDTNIPEQKPAWSEEDIQNIDNIIWLCANCEKGIENTWIPSQAKKIRELMERFKSLRPSWKPTQEQMEVMKEAVAYFGDSLISQKQKILESLYNDLLKLKSL